MLEAVRRGARRQIWECSPQHSSNAMCRVPGGSAARDGVCDLGVHPQNLADTVWAIAMLAIHDEELLEAVWRGAKCKL